MAASIDVGHMITILIMAAALGMDALSLGVGIGMKGIRLRDVLIVSLLVAFFHMVLPLVGMRMGQYVGVILGDVAAIAGGVLLVLLGGHMVYSSS